MKKLSRIYYSTGGYWKGLAAIPKLAEASSVDEDTVRKWLEKQVLWQIDLSPPKYVTSHAKTFLTGIRSNSERMACERLVNG